jgi:hypothetical protein
MRHHSRGYAQKEVVMNSIQRGGVMMRGFALGADPTADTHYSTVVESRRLSALTGVPAHRTFDPTADMHYPTVIETLSKVAGLGAPETIPDEFDRMKAQFDKDVDKADAQFDKNVDKVVHLGKLGVAATLGLAVLGTVVVGGIIYAIVRK